MHAYRRSFFCFWVPFFSQAFFIQCLASSHSFRQPIARPNVCLRVSVGVWVCACVCVCVREREWVYECACLCLWMWTGLIRVCVLECVGVPWSTLQARMHQRIHLLLILTSPSFIFTFMRPNLQPTSIGNWFQPTALFRFTFLMA